LDIVENEHYKAAQKMRSIMATYREAEDLINIGAYATGSNVNIDNAIDAIDSVKTFLQQDVYEKMSADETIEKLLSLTS
ncbi:MAG: ATPase, FliI/YscN family, partial [Firmicutes bacterium]|nr:ATPase, FliI/YscN family [Bacillota bacterium]